jgi:hypothetical protein
MAPELRPVRDLDRLATWLAAAPTSATIAALLAID